MLIPQNMASKLPQNKSKSSCSSPRDDSPRRKEKPGKLDSTLLIFMDYAGGNYSSRPLILEPGDYTKEELSMLILWTASDNIYEDFIIERKEDLPNPYAGVNTGVPTTLEEAAPHVELFNKLEATVQAQEYEEFHGEPLRFFHIKMRQLGEPNGEDDSSDVSSI